MKKNVFAAAACALACVLTSCSSESASGSSALEYPINASIESVTEATEPEIAPSELEISPDTTEMLPEVTEAPETTAAAETTEVSTEPATEAETDWTGKWECVSITIDGKTYSGNYMGVPLYASLAMELSSGGTGTMLSPMAGSEIEIKWSADGSDTISVGTEEEQLPAHMEDERLVMNSPDDGIDYYFERTDSFTEFDYDEWFENYDYRDYTDASSGEGT